MWLALLCVLLLVFIGAVQAVHLHTDGTDTHANCSLCVVAHVTVQTLAAFAAPAPIVSRARAERASRPRPSSRPPVFALFTRPPPGLPSADPHAIAS